MKHATAIAQAISTEAKADERYIRELLRFGKSKLHCISSYIGGVAATEACKLIMDQYIPMNNTLVFDGIHGRGSVFSL